jgi:hypothetical protein
MLYSCFIFLFGRKNAKYLFMTRKDESPAKQETLTAETTPSDVAPPQTILLQPEFGGRKGLEATRFGDWEINGKCVDF